MIQHFEFRPGLSKQSFLSCRAGFVLELYSRRRPGATDKGGGGLFTNCTIICLIALGMLRVMLCTRESYPTIDPYKSKLHISSII